MKFPGVLTSLFSKKEKEETYLSLYLDIHSVAASFWQMNGKSKVKTLASAHLPVTGDTWQHRTEAVDRLLGALEDKTNISDVTTTILGLPPVFLTPTGEIKKEIRSEVKSLSEELELTLAGFVPLHQALIYKLKTEEGVPPSVILLGINTKTIAVSMYKIGSLVGVRDIEEHEHIALDLENGLKSFTELEVLPARILLYGSDEPLLAGAKAKLMHHPWTTKANFLHFPKIEIVSFEMIVDAVSLAGASEMKSEMGEEKEVLSDEEDKIHVAEEVPEAEVAQEIESAKEVISEDYNVEMVEAESLGFRKNTDVIEESEPHRDAVTKEESEEEERITFRDRVAAFFGSIGSGSKKKYVGVALVALFGALLSGIVYWSVPHAVVTVLEVSKAIDTQQSVTIDPEATTVDGEHNIIPGRVREQTASGEKTIPVNGKKNVGDSAHGTLTIYNKSLSSHTFKKGSVLVSGSLKFTLDAETQIASATESIGSITFGKAEAAVTAMAIGAQSNMPASSEFTFADTSTSVATARNDAAFTGGTSREVVVVSRADYDNFVKTVSLELTEQAKQELGSAVTGGEQLVDGTIKTTVTEKVFNQEIDEEATALTGKVTIKVSGIAYSQEDIHALFLTSIESMLPSGYSVDDSNMTVKVSDSQVKKDGKITAKIQIHAVALPTIDTADLPHALAGKKLTDVEEYLKTIPGVGGMEVKFRFSPTKNRLPINKKNISVSIAIHK